MARKKTRRKAEDEYTSLAIRVEDYHVEVRAAINYAMYLTRPSRDVDYRDPVFRFNTDLTIVGTPTSPKKRVGERYELAIFGDDAPSRHLHMTIDDAQAHDERGVPQYRTYRGDSLPVYKAPPGIAVLHKVRGEPRWGAYVTALPRFVSDLLLLLGSGKSLYVALDERKDRRTRWMQIRSLQTTDPSEE